VAQDAASLALAAVGQRPRLLPQRPAGSPGRWIREQKGKNQAPCRKIIAIITYLFTQNVQQKAAQKRLIGISNERDTNHLTAFFMYRPRLTSDSYQSVRATLTTGYRQVQVEGVSDSVAVGFVREYGEGPGPLPAGYIVFQGKQSKASHHFSAKNIAEAEKLVDEALRAADWVAKRKAEDRKKAKEPKTAYTEHKDREVTVRSYSLTATANLIREALKAAFPAVKFSVTTDRFSGGTSLDIRYTDGPSGKQVKAVYAPFISGHFDGMQDMHVYNDGLTAVAEGGQLVRLSFGAKYIDHHRSYSAAYGHCLNSLDLREVPSLADQFSAFLSWHTAREYDLTTSYTENAGTYTLTSTSRRADLATLAAMLTAQGHAPTLTSAGDVQTLTVTGPASGPAPVAPAPTEPAAADVPALTPADPTAEITTDAQAAEVGARIDAIWALAEQRWQQGGRPLRFTGCSYFVVDSRQREDRAAYLTEAENSEQHQLTIQYSLYTNDPNRAHLRVLARLAELKAGREAQRQAQAETTEPASSQDSQDAAAEYEAAERHWLDEDTLAEYERTERRWLSDPGEWPAAVPPFLRY
jgi:hypothetical protein